MNFINVEKNAVLPQGEEGFHWPRANLLRTWSETALVFVAYNQLDLNEHPQE